MERGGKVTNLPGGWGWPSRELKESEDGFEVSPHIVVMAGTLPGRWRKIFLCPLLSPPSPGKTPEAEKRLDKAFDS